MKKLILISLVLVNANVVTRAQSTAIPLIFDTDIGNDCDDVLAMGVIHALQSRGYCRLIAVTITKDHEQCAPFTDAINTFYGRGDIPIGVSRSSITPQQSRFTGLVADRSSLAIALFVPAVCYLWIAAYGVLTRMGVVDRAGAGDALDLPKAAA